MEYRNPRYTKSGGIKVEINHPIHGWIPFAANKHDPEAYGRELFEHLKTIAGKPKEDE